MNQHQGKVGYKEWILRTKVSGERGEAEEPKSGEGEAVEMLERGQLHFS